ncbi:prolipoprotein diacylglyceryl transferase [Natronorarus salvus]|uniref:hypothetical protein n=1 Tax=Natronorarus salvus TaxID=3117733 RepID=UPI002F26D6F9
MTRSGKETEPSEQPESATAGSGGWLREIVEAPADPGAAVYEVSVRGPHAATLDVEGVLAEVAKPVELLGTAVSERGDELTAVLATGVDPVTIGELFGSAGVVESLDVEDVTAAVAGESEVSQEKADEPTPSRSPSLPDLNAAIAAEETDDPDRIDYDYRETSPPDPDPTSLDELLDAMADPEPDPGVEYLLSELRADHDTLVRRVEATERLSRLTVEATLDALAERDDRVEALAERVDALEARLGSADDPTPPEADR